MESKKQEDKEHFGIKEFGEVILNYGLLGVIGFTGLYALPTAIRKIRNISKKEKFDESLGYAMWDSAGWFMGAMGNIGLYVILASKGYGKALIIPATTTIVSGAYEIARNIKKNKLKKQGTEILEDMCSNLEIKE